VNEFVYLHHLVRIAIARWDAGRGDERGEVTEKVILIAVFAALAIAVAAIIVAKVTAKANSISTG
jgi:hypothetical protein